MNTRTKVDQFPAWRQLVELCQEINFGYIEDVLFQAGVPVSHGPAVKTIMPGPNKDNGRATTTGLPLRPQWAEVLAVAGSAPEVLVRRFEVAHGNPLKLHVAREGGQFHG
jgi:hypothetical protein